jgi:sporulation protein YlmC with PRC-barrel domain
LKPLGRIKLVSQLLDLPIVDKDERSCGIVDDIEFSGGPGEDTRIEALLVGPGAYAGRMPRWMYWIVRKIAGDRMARVPAGQIIEIGSVVKLRSRGERFELHIVENEVAAWIPRRGAY